MSNEISPTPWKLDDMACYIFDGSGNHQMVAEIRGWGHLNVTHGEKKAIEIQTNNGHILAAAPELYEAGKGVVAFVETLCKLSTTDDAIAGTVLKDLVAALNKAEGKL